MTICMAPLAPTNAMGYAMQYCGPHRSPWRQRTGHPPEPTGYGKVFQKHCEPHPPPTRVHYGHSHYVNFHSDNKRDELLSNLVNNWGPTSGQNHFTLTEATELLGILVSMCRVYPCGIFLFQNLYHAMYQSLARNAARIWHSNEFRNNIALQDTYSKHPTDSS
jgi:hypothetical protein